MPTTLIVKHRVANFETWKAVFDSMQSLRSKHGWVSHQVLRDATDPNLVTIINRVGSAEQAKAYGGSPELRSAMEKGGVLGLPEIQFLDDAEQRTY